jgi:hypothetical protein
VDPPGRRQFRTALAWQIALAVYMQLISWIPLGHWNYQPCCAPGLELLRQGALSWIDAVGTGAFLLPLILFRLGVRWQRRWMMWFSLLAITIWLGLQLWTWWPPYVFGASQRWTEVYGRAFAGSTPILPRWGNHLPPDAMHIVLQVLLSGAAATGIMALLRQPKRCEPSSDSFGNA